MQAPTRSFLDNEPSTVAFKPAKILAGDVILLAKGENMLNEFPKALELTHQYLHSMGAKVAPSKSLNFASSKAAKTWLADTTWIEINSKIKTVDDLRYLGGHQHQGEPQEPHS